MSNVYTTVSFLPEEMPTISTRKYESGVTVVNIGNFTIHLKPEWAEEFLTELAEKAYDFAEELLPEIEEVPAGKIHTFCNNCGKLSEGKEYCSPACSELTDAQLQEWPTGKPAYKPEE